MALNKSQTSLVAKILFSLLGIVLILGLAGPSLQGLMGIGGNDSTQTGSGGGVLDTIAAEHQGSVSSLQAALASDPTSATLLAAIGNTYFDWAAAIQQADVAAGTDQPYWAFASDYYADAIANGAVGPEIRTDMAVAFFYSGDVTSAIAAAEGALEMEPDFPTAHFNLGIFYEGAGDPAAALAAFMRYIELDPDGQAGNPEFANERIAELSQ